jgi:hypothetical protein
LESAVGAYPIVLPPPDLRLHLGVGKRAKHLHVQKFIPDFGVEALDKAFCQGFPGSIWTVFVPFLANHLFRAFSINSGPLSLRRYIGVPRADLSNGRGFLSAERSLPRFYRGFNSSDAARHSPSGRLIRDPWRGTLNFVFVNKNRVKIGISRISRRLEGELRRFDICERYSYSLIMSKKEGLRAHFSSLGFDMGNIG